MLKKTIAVAATVFSSIALTAFPNFAADLSGRFQSTIIGSPFSSTSVNWNFDVQFIFPNIPIKRFYGTPSDAVQFDLTNVVGTLDTTAVPLNQFNPVLTSSRGYILTVPNVDRGIDFLLINFELDPSQIDVDSVGATLFLQPQLSRVNLSQVNKVFFKQTYTGFFFESSSDADNREKVADILNNLARGTAILSERSPLYLSFHEPGRGEAFFLNGFQSLSISSESVPEPNTIFGTTLVLSLTFIGKMVKRQKYPGK